jgi:opacity protein-like surface antigen
MAKEPGMNVKTLLIVLLLSGLFLATGLPEAQAGFFRETLLQLENGYRTGRLDWNLAGDRNGGNPDVLSELEWEDLDIFQVKAAGRVLLGPDSMPHLSLCLKGSAAYGWITDGDNRDSDYAGDHRTLEYSRSENSGDDGNVLDLAVALGPQFHFLENRVAVALLAGWSYHEQNLKITDGEQTVSEPSLAGPLEPTGPIYGLDSSYDARWWGPWLGADLECRITPHLSTRGSFEYHFARYEGEADWNLRSDLAHPVSFRHDDHGRGIVLSAEAEYRITDNWSLNLDYTFQDWKTDNGIHRIYEASGATGSTRLNEVHWESHALMLGIGCRF